MAAQRRRSASPFDSFPAPVSGPLDDSANTGGAAVFLQDVGGLMGDDAAPPAQTTQGGLMRRRSEGGLLRGWSFRGRKEREAVEMQSLGSRREEGRRTPMLGMQMPSMPQSPRSPPSGASNNNNNSRNTEAERERRRRRGEEGMELKDVGGLLFVI